MFVSIEMGWLDTKQHDLPCLRLEFLVNSDLPRRQSRQELENSRRQRLIWWQQRPTANESQVAPDIEVDGVAAARRTASSKASPFAISVVAVRIPF